MKKLVFLAVALAVVAGPVLSASAGMHRFGGGVNYWRALDDLDERFDEDGLSYLVSYQYCPAELFRIEAAVEFYPDFAGSDEMLYAPQAFAILGGVIYGGLGIGIQNFDGEWADDPFYVFRVGLDLEVIPDSLHLDIYGRYQFTEWDDIDVDTDTVILGGALRLEF